MVTADIPYSGDKTVNGKYSDEERMENHWVSNDTDRIHWIAYDLGQAYPVKKIVLYHIKCNVLIDYTIQGSRDSLQWKDLCRETDSHAGISGQGESFRRFFSFKRRSHDPLFLVPELKKSGDRHDDRASGVQNQVPHGVFQCFVSHQRNGVRSSDRAARGLQISLRTRSEKIVEGVFQNFPDRTDRQGETKNRNGNKMNIPPKLNTLTVLN